MQTSAHQQLSSPVTGGFDLLFLVRLVFYMMIVLKLFEVVYLRKRKMNLKERIYRKFIFAHNEVIRTFSEEEKQTMESTLHNTLRNASISVGSFNARKSRTSKKVSFAPENNEYFQPHKDEQEASKINAAPQPIKDEDFINQTNNDQAAPLNKEESQNLI